MEGAAGRAGAWARAQTGLPAATSGPSPALGLFPHSKVGAPTRTGRGRRSRGKNRDGDRDTARPRCVEPERTRRHVAAWEPRGRPRPDECVA